MTGKLRRPWALLAVIGLAAAGARADDRALDVAVAVFDAGVPADRSLQRDLKVFPRIRSVEALLLPFVLRDTLAATGEWGAVRVVPEPDVAAELLITGEIGESDGETLQIRVRAVDASGRVWLERTFLGTVPDTRPLYAQITASLSRARASLDEQQIRRVREISMLRYASVLAPSAFGDYLDVGNDGTVTLLRLPAASDPMLARVRRLRETEYVITDAVDAKFRELFAEIASVYELWREYRHKTLEYEATNAERATTTASSASRGSFEDLKNQYDNYKWDRITAQEGDRLAVAFENEVGPKVEAMEARVAELRGWVDEKYATWHRLLEALFEAETEAEKDVAGLPDLPVNLPDDLEPGGKTRQ